MMVRIGDRFLRVSDIYDSIVVTEYEVIGYSSSGQNIFLKRFTANDDVKEWISVKELRKWNVEWEIKNGISQNKYMSPRLIELGLTK